MDYREYPVPDALQRHVRCLWHLRDATPSAAVQTIYPDGHCELIVHRATPMRIAGVHSAVSVETSAETSAAVSAGASAGEFAEAFSTTGADAGPGMASGWQLQSRSLFAAQCRSAVRLAASGPIDCIGVRLQAAASAVVAGPALPALKDRVVDLQTLDATFAAQLMAACMALDPDVIHTHDALFALLGARLLAELIDTRIESAVAKLCAHDGDLRIETLAAQLGMSTRALQMHFLNQVGLSAKEFARVQRLQASLRLLDHSTQPLSELALQQGYADQAHATRELQQFTGLTPARLRKALQQQRDSDDTIALAAAFVRGHARRR